MGPHLIEQFFIEQFFIAQLLNPTAYFYGHRVLLWKSHTCKAYFCERFVYLRYVRAVLFSMRRSTKRALRQ